MFFRLDLRRSISDTLIQARDSQSFRTENTSESLINKEKKIELCFLPSEKVNRVCQPNTNRKTYIGMTETSDNE